jgi:hypothetical protein
VCERNERTGFPLSAGIVARPGNQKPKTQKGINQTNNPTNVGGRKKVALSQICVVCPFPGDGKLQILLKTFQSLSM